MSTTATRTSLALGFCFASALAMANPESRSIVVSFDDLNLATSAGERTLHHRIAIAVAIVCGSVDARDLAENMQITACRNEAQRSAAPQVDLAVSSARKATSYAAADEHARGAP